MRLSARASLIFTAAALAVQTATPATDGAPSPLIPKYCGGCHNAKVKTAGIALDSAAPVSDDAGVWEKALRKLRGGEMPPPGLPRPSQEESKAFTRWLESELDRAAADHPNPGRPAIHRLNRAEYTNAVRDLLGLDVNVAADFPPDDSGYGFDNIADVLSVSPMLMEKYLAAAGRVSRLAVGNIKAAAAIDQVQINRKVRQTDRISDDLPFGSRGGAIVQRYFPLNAEYAIRVRVRGNGSPAKLDFRLDGRRVRLLDALISEREEDEESRKYEVRLPVKAGSRNIAVTFLRESGYSESVEAPPRAGGGLAIDYVQIAGPFNPTGPGDTESRRRIFTSRASGGADEERCAREILAKLARRAYRRPVADADVTPLLRFFRMGRQDGGSFDAGIQLALKAILVSPDFLFRVERDPEGSAPGAPHPVSDLELASRLSFFLWSSIPDEELLTLAEKRKLRDPAVLEAQIRRMLADEKSKALVTNFAGQWLYLRNLSEIKPDPDRFPEFDEALRQAFRRETEMFFGAIVHEDRSVLDALDANFSFLNERLAQHYGVAGVKGAYFRRVSLDGAERGGLLTQGSILTVSSYPTRTSPVLRGKWILENMLGAPPPPPPPNIPDLKEASADAPTSLRQRLELHRSAAGCAACHARMDPLGFALENYDAVGKWRTEDGKTAIDASGALPGGVSFNGPRELKSVLRSRREEFAQCLTEKLLTYALGRGVEYYDKPSVRKICREAAKSDYRFSALVLAISNSVPFQMRRTPEKP
jgi:cytochrome c551/c552